MWFRFVHRIEALLVRDILVTWYSVVSWHMLVSSFSLSSHETKCMCVCVGSISPKNFCTRLYTCGSGLWTVLKPLCCMLLFSWEIACNWWLGMLLVQTFSGYLCCGLLWNAWQTCRTIFSQIHHVCWGTSGTVMSGINKVCTSVKTHGAGSLSVGGRFTVQVLF